ncbi:hypothetical protein BpHYR1_026815 [Brachionus plicatilis]|uniref:Uncharacterized protein n=1 Tax=Brachionus plicatilis TaxID=10195 RepID=A0A3M7QCG6_BRAPC|nr:hypothetical protein BpHYR1_026815 [Brachionus plicatilis]
MCWRNSKRVKRAKLVKFEIIYIAIENSFFSMCSEIRKEKHIIKKIKYKLNETLNFFFWRNLITLASEVYQNDFDQTQCQSLHIVEETHFGDTPNRLTISFCFLSPFFSRPTISHFSELHTLFLSLFLAKIFRSWRSIIEKIEID